MPLLWAKNVCAPGRQALLCFLASFAIFTTSFFTGKALGYASELWSLNILGPAMYFCLINFVLKYFYKDFTYDLSIRSVFLGATTSLGFFLSTFDNGLSILGNYIIILSFFHFSEFMSVALTNPRTLSVDSFILNHSVQYGLAALASWIEFGIEYYFFPSMKTVYWLSATGVLVCIAGEIIRKMAMFTATTNFNHTVQFVKRSDHNLVTHGVYSFCRHPSYVGWFYWSIGTQLILLNPICTVTYALMSWMFFKERVYAEEATLISFFGKQYLNYQKQVKTGLPFINGYILGSERTRSENSY